MQNSPYCGQDLPGRGAGGGGTVSEFTATATATTIAKGVNEEVLYLNDDDAAIKPTTNLDTAAKLNYHFEKKKKPEYDLLLLLHQCRPMY